MSIRIGILGYGNLGRGVECAIKHNQDLELVAVFTVVLRKLLKFLQRQQRYILSMMPKK